MVFSFSNKIIYRYSSPVSGNIEVRDYMGKPVLMVEGVPQSGGLVFDILKKAVKALPNLNKMPNVLILGLGGGTVVHLLKKRWPGARITGVELDPNIVTVARTYFGLDQVEGVKIVVGDAYKLVTKKDSEIKKVDYDLIFVDLYLGDNPPDFVFDQKFLTELQSMLKNKGVLMTNCLMNTEGQAKIGGLTQVIKRLFARTKSIRVASNELIIATQD